MFMSSGLSVTPSRWSRSASELTPISRLEKAGDGVDEEREDDGVEAKGKHAVHQR